MTNAMSDNKNLAHAELTEKIIGVFYEVYNELGHGFLESVYQAAMMIALAFDNSRKKFNGPAPQEV